jgi:serine/threonine-protein kinase haspin
MRRQGKPPAAAAAAAGADAAPAQASRANATAGFVRTVAIRVTRGPYDPALCAAWRAYAADKGTENDFPGGLAADQLYAVFVLENGGRDLERFALRCGAEARAVLLQAALALAVAEEALQFEHRDLHWGNVLLARAPDGGGVARHTLRGVPFAAATEGLTVTVIDFSLSRVAPRGGRGAPICCNLEDDPELFCGPKGEAQFDTYRKMRKAVRADWTAFVPATNALWLAYLADTLLTKKAIPLERDEKLALRAFRSRAAKYSRASDALLDDLFAGMWGHAEAAH